MPHRLVALSQAVSRTPGALKQSWLPWSQAPVVQAAALTKRYAHDGCSNAFIIRRFCGSEASAAQRAEVTVLASSWASGEDCFLPFRRCGRRLCSLLAVGRAALGSQASHAAPTPAAGCPVHLSASLLVTPFSLTTVGRLPISWTHVIGLGSAGPEQASVRVQHRPVLACGPSGGARGVE